MKFTPTLPVSLFLNKFRRYAKKLKLPYKDIYLYGGCLRDYLLHKEINDYDITTNFRMKYIKKILKKMHVKYHLYKDDPFLYVYNKGIEYQFGEKETVITDFTINSFKCHIYNMEIVGSKKAFKDLENKKLRVIDPSARAFRRGIYMLYKFPDFTVTKNTMKQFKKTKINKAPIKRFIKDKKMSKKEFILKAKIFKKISI